LSLTPSRPTEDDCAVARHCSEFATGIATGRAETGRYQAIQIAMPTAEKANKIRSNTTKRDGQGYPEEVYKIDQSTGRLGEPNRYPAGNGANWVEIVEVQ
jgi:hypothetical protein